jgi:putative transposase
MAYKDLSSFRTKKRELIALVRIIAIMGSVFATRKEANAVLFDYIEIYYNRIRRHSANVWLSPEAFEQKYFKNLEGFVVHDTV